ncbi:MAG: biotin carboxylase N-terminal domain-containing protein [Candidatus Nanopelagicales bacterium]
MSNDMAPPEGELVDASDFWARRNQPTSSEASGTSGSNGPSHGAEVPFKRLLVANRGEIACRVFRTARDLGIQTVAVFSDPDRSAAHVREADIAVAIGGTTSSESYLDTAKILDAAVRAGADAIHPGYGFLSENPDFAQAVIDAGIAWVGPTPDSIRSMALKVEAKRLAEAAGVPLVPGAELEPNASNTDLTVVADGVGYPLLVKASAGGGGKGMRVVSGPEDLIEAVETARREAQNSFGDSTVFFERYLTGARHVEVQVFGDTHGNVVHLFERECSIQRRHQKIVEESPSPGTTTATLDRMYSAATALTREIGYVGAGTVEFLVFGEGADQVFYFLEMNTRLQVEHPVTEEVTGQNLVHWQLIVAAGGELPLAQTELRQTGHAIEVRLYAEDPANNYLPSTGRLTAFGNSESKAPLCREDSGFAAGDEVSPYYDPMLSKIISHAPDRSRATHKLAANLRARDIAGVLTNRESLVAILESDEFASGETTTDFLDRYPQLLCLPVVAEPARERALIAATLGREAISQEAAAWNTIAPVGWRNISSVPQRADWSFTLSGETVDAAIVRWPEGGDAGLVAIRPSDPAAGWSGPVSGDSYRVDVLETIQPIESRVQRIRIRLSLNGLAREYTVSLDGDLAWVGDGIDSQTFRLLPRFADLDLAAAGGGPAAPVPGTVVSVEVATGDEVAEGQTLVVLEAMKMEHRITAAAVGVVDEVLVNPGDSVDAHQVLVTLQ